MSRAVNPSAPHGTYSRMMMAPSSHHPGLVHQSGATNQIHHVAPPHGGGQMGSIGGHPGVMSGHPQTHLTPRVPHGLPPSHSHGARFYGQPGMGVPRGHVTPNGVGLHGSHGNVSQSGLDAPNQNNPDPYRIPNPIQANGGGVNMVQNPHYSNGDIFHNQSDYGSQINMINEKFCISKYFEVSRAIPYDTDEVWSILYGPYCMVHTVWTTQNGTI